MRSNKWVYYHTDCGGLIDTRLRSCTKCKKKWNWFMFIFDYKGIRIRMVRG